MSIRKRYAVFALLAAAILAVLSVWLREGNGPGSSQRLYQGKTLEAWFNQLQGPQGDAVVATFREIGTDAVAFLGAQSRKHDSVLKLGYITLWPKLPAFLKSKLKQPTNAVPIRVKALGALRRMRPGFTKLEPGMTILIEALNDPSEEVRSIAEGALGDIGPEAAAAVHALIRSVERGGFSINGIWALGRIGPEAKPAGPLLKAIVRRKTGRQLVYAAEALWRIEQSNTMSIPALIKGLGDSDRQTQAEAAEALRQIGEPAKCAVAALTEALRDSEQRVRLNAARALVEIGAEGNDAVEMLSGILNASNSSGWDGVMAAESLLKRNPDSDDVIAFLRQVVQGERVPVGNRFSFGFYDRSVRVRAAAILGRTGREIELVISVLSEAVIYGELTVKEMAIPALGQQGSKAKAAIPRLDVAARSNDREVRKAAEDALRRIAGNEPSTTKE